MATSTVCRAVISPLEAIVAASDRRGASTSSAPPQTPTPRTASDHRYSSRGCTPHARAVPVVKVSGDFSDTDLMDRTVAFLIAPCNSPIHRNSVVIYTPRLKALLVAAAKSMSVMDWPRRRSL